MGDLNPQFQGVWHSVLDPYYGYLHIKPDGQAVAIVHALHGKTDPPIEYFGVWKATDLGWEVLAGPYHWTNIALFTTPATETAPLREFFTSLLNGKGRCNLGKLPPGGDMEMVKKESEELPPYQSAPSMWKDYPSQPRKEAAAKYMDVNNTFIDSAQQATGGGSDMGQQGGGGGQAPAPAPEGEQNKQQ